MQRDYDLLITRYCLSHYDVQEEERCDDDDLEPERPKYDIICAVKILARKHNFVIAKAYPERPEHVAYKFANGKVLLTRIRIIAFLPVAKLLRKEPTSPKVADSKHGKSCTIHTQHEYVKEQKDLEIIDDPVEHHNDRRERRKDPQKEEALDDNYHYDGHNDNLTEHEIRPINNRYNYVDIATVYVKDINIVVAIFEVFLGPEEAQLSKIIKPRVHQKQSHQQRIVLRPVLISSDVRDVYVLHDCEAIYEMHDASEQMMLSSVLLPFEVYQLLDCLSMEALPLIRIRQSNEQGDAFIDKLTREQLISAIGMAEVLADLRKQINRILDLVHFVIRRIIVFFLYPVGCEMRLRKYRFIMLTKPK